MNETEPRTLTVTRPGTGFLAWGVFFLALSVMFGPDGTVSSLLTGAALGCALGHGVRSLRYASARRPVR